jgi:hypothetical protein
MRWNTTTGQLEVYGASGTWEQLPASTGFDFVLQTRPAVGKTASAIIPKGTSAQAETPGSAGWLRYNTDFNELQLFNGTDWDLIAPSQGAVSSFVQAAAPTARNVGDLWYDTVLERESVWDGGSWVQPGVTQTGPTGAAQLPVGLAANRPTGAAGLFRYNSGNDFLEYYDATSSTWQTLVRNVTGTQGIIISGTPLANTGNINVTLSISSLPTLP